MADLPLHNGSATIGGGYCKLTDSSGLLLDGRGSTTNGTIATGSRSPASAHLGDLVGVIRRRDAGADVQELPYPGLGGQETHRTAEKRPVGLISRVIVGRTAMTSSAAILSAWKWSLPPPRTIRASG